MDNGASSYRRFLDGDDEGFTEIIRDYKDGLILFLLGIVGNLDLAEELAEDTFVKIVIKKPGFRGKSSFKTWLYAIGRHTAMDAFRKKQSCDLSTDELEEFLHTAESVEQDYFRKERDRTLHLTMRELNPAYRQVLWLIYFENLSNKEAAQIMKKSVHSIETLVYRARQALKSELEKKGYTYEEL